MPRFLPQELCNLPEESNEYNRIIFRFNDFNDKTKKKLSRLLKNKSSIYSVHSRVSLKDIEISLSLTNPIIFRNYSNSFSFGQFPRWREKQLSRIIYYSCCRRPNESNIETLKYYIVSN